ncbi:hypothetical protein BGW36DRAFT_397081 [Talaromyces proteolyticus]|uniref:Uncharacterized protein n=1 Tax=Talaromyces proteolyticus TaxID=1131652 RepID=A0AAD4KUJ7_9EURO|nr:uncharacterized protein BGW36DRAFT_397081 [Talaromyces proteolyticus]KAH8697330.1 hypothetical protein BGW36DRAFT_397081 [Talaromyces proteolyticus]
MAAVASLEESLEHLSIQNKRPEPDISRLAVKKPADKSSKKKKGVADSWEDELSSGSGTETEETTAKIGINSPSSKSEGPLAPPPTPITYQGDFTARWEATSSGPTSRRESPHVRPEKQTAVANRMIAGALGIRAPKRTEEQRAYDRAAKEKEIRRRNKAKEDAAKAIAEEEKAKTAVWDE